MKKLKILAVRTHYMTPDGNLRLSAVDAWRIQNPLEQLQKHTNWEIDFVNKVIDSKGNIEQQWDDIGKKYDVIYTSYIDTPTAYSYMKALQFKYGTHFIMDLDDNIFEVDDMNPAAIRYYEGSPEKANAEAIIADSEAMSVTTPHLKYLCDIRRNGKPTALLPNFIDKSKYVYNPKLVPDNGERVVIGYQGSATHYTDLMKTGVLWALRELMKKYDNVDFCVVGAAFDEIKDFLPENRVKAMSGERDFNKWTKLWQKLPFDIGIAPLVDTSFNRAKSSIKFYEYSLRKIPAVFSYVEPYREKIVENKTGFLATDEMEWFEKLSWLIENRKLRYDIAESARDEVLKKYTLQGNWQQHKNFIEEVTR